MKDKRKFLLFIVASILLISSAIIFNILGDSSSDITSYLERRFYYERVISKKGLSLHRALYWRQER